MDDYGLTLEELDAAGCFAPPPPPPEPPPPPAPPPPAVCYRNAEGLTWDGQGEMPSWLKRAVNAGQSVEFFGAANIPPHLRVAKMVGNRVGSRTRKGKQGESVLKIRRKLQRRNSGILVPRHLTDDILKHRRGLGSSRPRRH